MRKVSFKGVGLLILGGVFSLLGSVVQSKLQEDDIREMIKEEISNEEAKKGGVKNDQ